MIAPYLDDGVEAPEALRAPHERGAGPAGGGAGAVRGDDEAAQVFRRWLPLMRRARTDLENHNHYIDQMSVGQLRAAILAAGRRLVDRGLLARARRRLLAAPGGDHAGAARERPGAAPRAVAGRKRQWEAWERMAPPPVLGLPERPAGAASRLPGRSDREAVPEAGAIRGVGASAGRVRGRARVIPSGAPLPDVAPGEILVAEGAGPAWTPLFPMLGGLILEHGALFSHAATTAREYGIPAVINVKDATLRIPDGRGSRWTGRPAR